MAMRRSLARRCDSQMRPKVNTAPGVAFGRTGDGGPAVLAVFEKGAWEGRREAVLEIGFGAEFGQIPLRKLTAQQEAKAFAEDEAFAAAAEFGAGATLEIEQVRGPLAPGEALYGEFEPSGGGDLGSDYAAGEIACAVPGLECESGAADFKRVRFRREGKRSSPGSSSAGSLQPFRKSSSWTRSSSAVRPGDVAGGTKADCSIRGGRRTAVLTRPTYLARLRRSAPVWPTVRPRSAHCLLRCWRSRIAD